MSLTKMFGRSPFVGLKSHMDKVSSCVEKLNSLFAALEKGDHGECGKIAKHISKLEHEADLVKNDIRNHLPKSLFIAIDRARLLEILELQDAIADCVEDIAVLLTLKELTIPEVFKEEFKGFLQKNIDACTTAKEITDEIHDLLESTFGGVEAQVVRDMVDKVAFIEHEVDLEQRKLLKKLFLHEDEFSMGAFHMWLKLIEQIATLSNIAEKLANRVRMTLD